MNIKVYLLFFIFCFLVLGCQTNSNIYISLSAYESVNPFIGTGGHGHTFPGATLPGGMVQLSPDTRLEGWDGCSGYHYTDTIVYGFSHTHLSGTGISDYGDVLLMPAQGEQIFDNGYKTGVENGYSSTFHKSSEFAAPGYYGMHLDKYDIDVRLTSTLRTGIHEYTFNRSGPSHILLDLEHRDQLLDQNIAMVNHSEIAGKRISKEWAQEQHIYFVIQFSKPISSISYNSEKTKAAISFKINEKEKLLARVGISAVSVDGARKNLEEEANHWDFNYYYNTAKREWEKELKKIEIATNDEEKKIKFYTAMYHSLLAPNIFSDVDGKYRGMDQMIHTSEDGPVYTVFSLWDTFRAAHPLYTIINQKKTNEYIRTFLKQYKSGGELPIWELAGNYTGCMIGYHSIPVIADAYIKGFRGFDEQLALEAMVHSSVQDKLGLSAYKSKGFIASGDESESVSKTLEYAYDDWCIAEMAKSMNNEDVHKEYIKRSQYYKNIFNPEVGFMQGKMNGAWSTGFDPGEVNFNFTEANSWQYSMFVPQDISGLIDLYGGEAQFEKKLDELFTTEMELSGREQADITGLIGQYAHGNEPSHHMAYLYNYIGKPWKTQKRINQILNEQYTTLPDGLSGNEDCGQMSAWYVLSSMGFYAVTPGTNYYAIGTPHHDTTTINLENGNIFTIVTNNLNSDNIYVQSVSLNGNSYNKSFIYHEDIVKGGEMVFEMGDKANEEWGKTDRPVSKIESENEIIPVPYFTNSNQTFTQDIEIGIKSINAESDYYYSINDLDFVKYESPIILSKSSTVRAYAINNNKKSFTISGSFKKIKGGRSIKIDTEYSNQYSGGGQNGLIDLLTGTSNFRTGYWQGYHGQDFSAIVDLGHVENIHHISLGALQDIKSWIWFPNQVTISTSVDGTTFSEWATINNDFPDNREGGFTKEFGKKINTSKEVRFVKVEAQNYGFCPKWHPGDGNITWLFFDEITIE